MSDDRKKGRCPVGPAMEAWAGPLHRIEHSSEMNPFKLQLIFLVLALAACRQGTLSPEDLARQVPILAAAIDCKPEKLKTLAEDLTPADLAREDSKGSSALYWAIEKRCDAGVEILLEAGVDPNRTAVEVSL